MPPLRAGLLQYKRFRFADDRVVFLCQYLVPRKAPARCFALRAQHDIKNSFKFRASSFQKNQRQKQKHSRGRLCHTELLRSGIAQFEKDIPTRAGAWVEHPGAVWATPGLLHHCQEIPSRVQQLMDASVIWCFVDVVNPERWNHSPMAMDSKRVEDLRKASLMFPVGPLRCLAIISSATPLTPLASASSDFM